MSGSLEDYDEVERVISSGRHPVHIAIIGGVRVAVKQYLLHDASALRHVKRELGLLARLQHPNIIRVQVRDIPAQSFER